MAGQSYKVVYKEGNGEIVEKKSRFIATVQPVESEAEAVAFINRIKKQYWDATHNCSAFTVGKNHELTRCSDDGEPAQTAGRPMLDVLLKENIHNAAVVVTRYFGGTLLGTGGLVRAYQKAVQEGLAGAVVIEKQAGQMLSIDTDYTGLGKIQYLLGQHKIAVQDTEYTQKAVVHAVVPCEKKELVVKAITEGTSATAKLDWGAAVEYAVIAGEVKIL